MENNIFLQDYFRMTLNILMVLIKFICGNLLGCQKKNIENIIKSNSLLASTFILPDVNFNNRCLINASIPKKVNIYVFFTY